MGIDSVRELAALLTTAGNTNIRVLNPAPAGGYSISLVFTVVTPAPVLDTVRAD